MGKMFAAERPGCFRCHGDKRGPFTFEHAPVRFEGCTSCHEPHGSVNPRMLTRGKVEQTCLECRANLPGSRATNAPGGVTPPAFHNLNSSRFQNCTICHRKCMEAAWIGTCCDEELFASPATGVICFRATTSRRATTAAVDAKPADAPAAPTEAKPADAKPADAKPADAPAAAAAASPVPTGESWLTGFVDIGYRWRTDVAGSVNTYRSIVNLGSGPKLLATEFIIRDKKRRLFDRMEVHAYNSVAIPTPPSTSTCSARIATNSSPTTATSPTSTTNLLRRPIAGHQWLHA